MECYMHLLVRANEQWTWCQFVTITEFHVPISQNANWIDLKATKQSHRNSPNNIAFRKCIEMRNFILFTHKTRGLDTALMLFCKYILVHWFRSKWFQFNARISQWLLHCISIITKSILFSREYYKIPFLLDEHCYSGNICNIFGRGIALHMVLVNIWSGHFNIVVEI